ncbi:MAG: hypothetical protein GY769_02330 [bacterium]|nr:hypothetical protein [bacterium]
MQRYLGIDGGFHSVGLGMTPDIFAEPESLRARQSQPVSSLRCLRS